MKNTWKLAPLFVLAFVTFGCGGGGSASAEGVGEAVLAAIQAEDYPAIYENFDPWTADAMQWRKDSAIYDSETTKDWWKNNKDRYVGENSMDPGKKLEIADKETLFALEPYQGTALMEGWYQKAHKWEKFTDRMADMRLIGVKVRHGLEGDGSGSVSYANKYGDSLEVSVTRIGGVWYADGVELNGQEKLPVAE